MATDRKLHAALLFLLLAAAFLLRIQSWHAFTAVDEEAILSMVWGLNADPLPPGMPAPLPGYPPMFIYLNFLLSLLYRELLVFLGVFASSAEFLASPAAREFTAKAGQLLVAVFGTLHVALVWKIGREFFNRPVAWLAALLVAFHPHLVLNSHIFKSDIPLALLFALLLLYSLRFLRSLASRHFFAACFSVGLIAACKFNGAVQALLIPFLLWLSRRELLPGRARRLLLLSPLFGLLGFVVLAPNWLVHPLQSLQAAVRYALFHFSEFTFYDRVHSTYGRYLADIWQTLGPLFLSLFLFGVLFAFLRRNQSEATITASFLLYFVVQGRSVFFGSRIILPVLGAVALLAAKGAFCDLLPLIRSRLPRRILSTLVLLAAGFAALFNMRDSLARFNLWKTSSTLAAAAAFRRDHIPAEYRFARENFTPIQAGDKGVWDLAGIPDGTLFHGASAMPFLSSGILSDYLLHDSRNAALKKELLSRLSGYRVFHRVAKPRFSPWDGDILFHYRPHPRLLSYYPGNQRVALPRLFRDHPGNTIFLPRQPYEKDPGFFPLAGNHFGKWLLAGKPIRRLELALFCPQGEISLKVRLNRHEIYLAAANGVTRGFFADPRPLPLHKAPLYRIDILLAQGHAPAFLLLQDDPWPPSPPLVLASRLNEEPPPLFSSQTPPGWARELYRRTGIDVQLLALTQQSVLWENAALSLQPQACDWTALPRGIYRMQLETEPLAATRAAEPPPPLGVELSSADRRQTTLALPWEREADGVFAAILDVPEEMAFVRFRVGDLRRQNLLARRLRLRPDYLRSLRAGYASSLSERP